jgi:hypothetical protein
MGIEDHDSWLRREYAPSGHASGWRRQGCLLMLGGTLLVTLVIVVVAALL